MEEATDGAWETPLAWGGGEIGTSVEPATEGDWAMFRSFQKREERDGGGNWQPTAFEEVYGLI